MLYRLVLAVAVTILVSVPSAVAQELDCDVSVDAGLITDTQYDYLDGFDRVVEEYLNNHVWTDDRFLEHERLDCSFSITFMEAVAQDRFTVNLVVASRRPIYGTSQSSTVVRFNDAEWAFSYPQGTPLIHDENTIDPVASVLDFYAYVLLGYDYDTFSELGGTPHFERARRIAEKARTSNSTGWTTMGDDRGRYDLASQLLDTRYRPLRRAYFTYHYHGLDRFVTKTEAARTSAMDAIQSIQEVYDQLSRQYTIDLFFSTKSTELAAIFERSDISTEAYEVLTDLDPANMSTYERLIQ